jgi:uncharacterized protein YecT (DUF1311 family)
VTINLLKIVFVAAVLTWSSASYAQYAGDKDPGHLVLSTAMCDYLDTMSIANCLDDQNKKVDRWLNAIVESYARWATEAMADLAHGGEPVDQVAQLRAAEAAFKQYRSEAAELVNVSGLVGSINKFMAARTYFDLTIDRARLLLETCISRPIIELGDTVDLTRVDWCPPAL